ncbi:hypothetical protein [Flavobacterium okayamense]|uniref:TonB protein C-terminal n=1 Tax=Flavobacterium okayamense TaxID=2830782 RepID=A0ABN6I0Q7_9FLAO|nr:hypothetical protein [Flavobacterium okayamense]BCY29600.1 hypothetical protein KK2020170_24680 [Flavobacterium okayamense]
MKFYLLFTFFITTFFFGQEVKKEVIYLSSSVITDDVFSEALEKDIKSDRVLISFIVNKECDIIEIKIFKEGKLVSFNKSVLKNMDKIEPEILDNLDCDDLKIKQQNIKMFVPIHFKME